MWVRSASLGSARFLFAKIIVLNFAQTNELLVLNFSMPFFDGILAELREIQGYCQRSVHYLEIITIENHQ